MTAADKGDWWNGWEWELPLVDVDAEYGIVGCQLAGLETRADPADFTRQDTRTVSIALTLMRQRGRLRVDQRTSNWKYNATTVASVLIQANVATFWEKHWTFEELMYWLEFKAWDAVGVPEMWIEHYEQRLKEAAARQRMCYTLEAAMKSLRNGNTEEARRLIMQRKYT